MESFKNEKLKDINEAVKVGIENTINDARSCFFYLYKKVDR
jgi:hypothetical protein